MPTKTPLAFLVEEGPVPVPLGAEIQRYVLKLETSREGDSRLFTGLAKDLVTGMLKDPQIIDWSEISCEEEGWHKVEIFLLPDGTSEFIEISVEFDNQGPQTRRLQVALPRIERSTPKLSPGKNLEITFSGKFLKGCRIEFLDQTARIRYWEQNAEQNRITLVLDVHPGNQETVRFQLIDPTGNVITQTVGGQELTVVLDGPQDPNQKDKPSATKPVDREEDPVEEPPQPTNWPGEQPEIEDPRVDLDPDNLMEEDPWEDEIEPPFESRKKSWLEVVIGIAIFAVPLLINFFFLYFFLNCGFILAGTFSAILAFGYFFSWMYSYRLIKVLLIAINLLGIGTAVLFLNTSWFSKTPPSPPTLMMIVRDDAEQPLFGAEIFSREDGALNGVLLATSDSLGKVSVSVKPQTPIMVQCDGYQVDTVLAKSDQVIRLIKFLTKAKVYLTSAVNCRVDVKTDDGQTLQTVSLDGPELKIIEVPVRKNIIFDFRIDKDKAWKADTLNIPSSEERWLVEINSLEKLTAKKMEAEKTP